MPDGNVCSDVSWTMISQFGLTGDDDLRFRQVFILLKTNTVISRWYYSLSPPFHRVSLTYRVKSAHKIKLTDKQLLQWLTPMLLIMVIYLSAWSLSATPTTDEIRDSSGLKFLQCEYNWWDHSLAMGKATGRRQWSCGRGTHFRMSQRGEGVHFWRREQFAK